MTTGRTDTVSGATGDRSHSASAPRMWSAAWRQHRFWVIGTVALVATGGLVLAAIALLIPACASMAWWETAGATCERQPARLLWGLYGIALAVLPVIAGAVLGAVTFGPDKEHRTQVYALTQGGATRIRWWTTKVVTVAAPVFAATVLLGMATLWVVNGSDNSIVSSPRITSLNFDILSLIPATRFLVAYAAAAAAALLWRTVGGILIGLVAGAVVVIGSILLQPLVVPHTRDLIPVDAWWTSGQLAGGPDTAYNWSGYADADGSAHDMSAFDCPDSNFLRCLQDDGVVYRVETYVLDTEYHQMMLVISGFNLVVAGGLLAVGARTVRRQDL